ncbi:MAG: deoxyguanosinetriphosphate triphosphohydrolase [Alphaproteobacteria bacterium]|nr:deoxyguanosinetriphosphate triphosphohydrolase [Alphaproteobacteria bacterium]
MASGKASKSNTPPGRLLGPIYSPPPLKATFASRAASSRGRFHPEPESPTRTCYQRDRDRIIHSTAFRRLKHKTQVFVQHEGDYYRTRLTHSIEVSQIARSLARTLAVDEDLAETLALAHDLGHTPFGHAGEEALDRVSQPVGGFDHNAHALRLVTELEHRYAGFDGLNLTWETLEGLVKHNGPPPRPYSEPVARLDRVWSLDLSNWPSLEAQLASLADDIAYVAHDIDDGLRSGVFNVTDLADVALAGPVISELRGKYAPNLELGRFIGELASRLIGTLIDDLVMQTSHELSTGKPHSANDVRCHGAAMAAFSPAMGSGLASLKAFLFAQMYRHPRVMEPMLKARSVITELFGAFADKPSLLPQDWAAGCASPNDPTTLKVVRDYIAGMTDRFALSEFRRIFHSEMSL